MNKAQFIDKIAEEINVSKVVAGKALDTFVQLIMQSLRQGEEVVLPKLGKFLVSERAARMGRDPRTGNPINIPARSVAVFKPAKELKEVVGTATMDSN